MEEREKMVTREKSTRKAGAWTTGITMIVAGSLFLIHMVYPNLSYRFIFHLWPFALIGLGVELLVKEWKKEEVSYDMAAIWMMILTLLFSFCMAVCDLAMQYGEFCLPV